MLLSSDRKLLKRFRDGEPAAFGRVYDEYAPAIAAFLAGGFTFSSRGRMLRFRGYHQPFDLENALHETLARAFSERARLAYDGLSSYKTYLIAIAKNLVLTELRRREVAMSQLVRVQDGEEVSPAIEVPDDEAPVACSAPEPSAEAAFLHRELAKLYQLFVEQLDERERGFFSARFEQRATQVEAGKRVGLSHMQARTVEKKLRKRFLKFMQAHGYLEQYAGKHAAVVAP